MIARGYAGTDLVPPRFMGEPSATPESFVARAKLFHLLDDERIKKLETPTMVSSLHGPIERLLFTIPGWVFFPENDPNNEALIRKYATAFRGILGTLHESTKPLILVHQRAEERARQWMQQLGLGERAEIVTAPDYLRYTVWAEDAYCMCEDLSDNETYFVEPATFKRADDAYIADTVAPASDLEHTQVQLYFQGGNVLIGDDFWFIGADYPAESLRLGLVKPRGDETEAEAIHRAYGNAMETKRKLIVVGSRVPVPSMAKRPIVVNGQQWEEILYFGNKSGTVQPLFHIDMFITLVGRGEDGKYTVLVADPGMAADILGEQVPDGAMQTVFNDIAAGLATLGFNVIRNPIPMAYDDDVRERLRYWYFATANNVIVQDDPKRVWIPSYGHEQWSKLSATDDANRNIWQGLGYSVEMLADFHPFAANLGAAHCITKYLQRGG